MDNLMLADTEMGISSATQVEELSKALLAPSAYTEMYDTTQTPGGVNTMQSLEGMLVDLTLNANDFTFWHDMNKIKEQLAALLHRHLGHAASQNCGNSCATCWTSCSPADRTQWPCRGRSRPGRGSGGGMMVSGTSGSTK